jgi:tetratricopeptide (TPR) repeat protein
MARLSRYEKQYLFDIRPRPLDEAKAAVSAAPQSARAHVGLALAMLRAHQPDDASREVQEALRLDPRDANAHYVGAKLAATQKDLASEQSHLVAIKAGGGDGYTVEMGLAEVAETRGDGPARRAALEAAHRFDPTQVEPVKELLKLAKAEKRDADVLVSLRDIARLDQHDRVHWRELLSALVAAKQWDEAKRIGEAALYVDVQSSSIHADYARALASTGDHETAAFELESSLLCDAKPAERAAQHALLARERQALGDLASARAHRDEALKLDPQNVEARALKL